MSARADHFAPVAPDYAVHRPGYPAGLFDWIVQQSAGRALVWDCACGSGQASVPLAQRFERVLATDSSAAQLAEATPGERIDYRLAPADSSGLESASADAVTVAQALHWFDPPAFYAEALRVLRPCGLLVAWSYGPVRARDPAIDAGLDGLYADLAPYWPPERRHVDEGYARLPFPAPRLEVPPFEMQVSWPGERLMGYVGTWSATARYQQAQQRSQANGTRAAPLDALLQRRLPAVCRASSAQVELYWPLTVLAARRPAAKEHSWQVLEDPGPDFERALPPRPVPWMRRTLFWMLPVLGRSAVLRSTIRRLRGG